MHQPKHAVAELDLSKPSRPPPFPDNWPDPSARSDPQLLPRAGTLPCGGPVFEHASPADTARVAVASVVSRIWTTCWSTLFVPPLPGDHV